MPFAERVANARMYSVSPEAEDLWRSLLSAVFAVAGLPMKYLAHAFPQPLPELWNRRDLGAAFMCGLPFSLAAVARATVPAKPLPVPVAAPVPAPHEFLGQPQYWSDFVVRRDSPFHTVADTFGSRIAFTVPDSQSGYAAALAHFMRDPAAPAWFAEIIAPTITPLGALCAVADGAADVAPIDAYALSLLRTFRPHLVAQVRVIGRTAPTPIPLLVASDTDVDALQTAFLDAHRHAPTRRLMDRLLLQRFVRPDASAYGRLRERFDAASGYWHSHRLATVIHPAFETPAAAPRISLE